MNAYTDTTLMPFGQYKGTALGNVPAAYLLYCLREMTNLSAPLKKYIEDHKRVLETQAKRQRRFNAK
jgi:hypothetical protein